MQSDVRSHLQHHLLFYLAQLGAVALAIHWWRNLPAPGYAVAVLAFLAAVMSIHGDMRPWQKAVWMLLIGACLVVEFRAITKDRADYADAEERRRKDAEATRHGENDRFDSIANSLNANIQISQQHFSAMMLRMERAAKSQKQTFDWISGGDAFVTVMVDIRTLQLEVVTQGPQPLRDVYLNIFNVTPENIRETFNTAFIVPVGTVYPTVIRHLDRQLPVSGNSASFQINIYQTNGFFTEYLNLEKPGNFWQIKSMTLYRNKDGKKLIP